MLQGGESCLTVLRRSPESILLILETEEMIKHGEEFQREAVRIALTSGLPRKRVAADLGIGLSTLTRWVSLHRGEDFPTSPDADLARENEQLRRENHILKEERDILKKATQFFASQNREVRVRGELAPYMAGGGDLPGSARQHPWLPMLAVTPDQPASAHGHESAGAYPGTVQLEPWQLWSSSYDDGVEGGRPRCR